MSETWPMPQDDVLCALLKQIRKYGKKELLSQYETFEKNGQFPNKAVKWLAEMGVFGLIIPVEYGGSGMGAEAAAYVARELAYWWPGLHLIWTAHNLAVEVIIQAGTDEQKRLYLPRMAAGEIGAFGLTSPAGGSDALTTNVEAEFDLRSKCYSLTGDKCFTTNLEQASIIVVTAHHVGFVRKDISAFVIDMKTGSVPTGFTVSSEGEKYGFKCASFCRLGLNNVSVHESARLGKSGEGFRSFMHSLAFGRIGIGAQSIGMSERIFYEAMKYCRDRKMFGGTLWDKQTTQHDFAKARAKLWVAWQGVVAAARKCDAHKDFKAEASYVKYVATETAKEAALAITEMFGGQIVLTTHPYMQRLIEILLTGIYEGHNRVQLDIISKYLAKEFGE
ncbi:acyl-CoA dehydrogenase family protein [Candidatus Kaiserbacteria bacterium]|nr:acyl-CoA dehydrogenase family protein [Candidatus Kaiserbacteria bacterium]